MIDWTPHATRAEAAMKRGSDALLLGKFHEALEQFKEAEKQLCMVLFWIKCKGET